MKKCLSLILVFVMITVLVGCATKEDATDTGKSATKGYSEKIAQLVTDKGYTVEEIAGLKLGQEVDKAYDNEVLARFGKVQGYVYDVTLKWNDGFFEGPITDKRVEYSVLPLDKMKEENKDYYDDNMHFGKYTIKLSKMMIFDLYFSDDLSSSYWFANEESNGICENVLSEEDINQINLDEGLKQLITQKYSDFESSIQFKMPDISE